MYWYQTATVLNCKFEGNIADSEGGSLCIKYISSFMTSNTTYKNDYSTVGSNIYLYNTAQKASITDCRFKGSSNNTRISK